jgi:hypothetical protein
MSPAKILLTFIIYFPATMCGKPTFAALAIFGICVSTHKAILMSDIWFLAGM